MTTPETLETFPVDIQSLDRWDDYTEAKNAMFFHTHTGDAPWVIIRSDDKNAPVSTVSAISCISWTTRAKT